MSEKKGHSRRIRRLEKKEELEETRAYETLRARLKQLLAAKEITEREAQIYLSHARHLPLEGFFHTTPREEIQWVIEDVEEKLRELNNRPSSPTPKPVSVWGTLFL